MRLPDALDATGRPSPVSVSRSTVAFTIWTSCPPPTALTPARARARAAALRHADRQGTLPTVSALAAAAEISCGTAAT
jgi:hypothetical protein